MHDIVEVEMSRLSEVAKTARKVIKYGSIGLVGLIIFRMIWNVGVSWWKARNPEPPPPPDTRFGKLPPIKFPSEKQVDLSYSLQTETGGLPNISEQFEVYFMPIKKPNLLAYDEAVTLANKIGFITEPEKLSEERYRWNSSSPIPSTLTMNIITGEFVLDRRWQDDESYLTPKLYIEKERAVDLSYSWLSRYNLLPDDIGKGRNKVETLKAENGQLVSAISLSQSQFLRVNLFRAPIAETPVLTPDPNKGLISLVVAFQRKSDRQFVRVDYSYFPVEKEQSASYPLIGVETAWQRVQNGEGYIASISEGAKEIIIREVYLAYYDSDSHQQFMQPVYVFEGSNNFVGYVPAIADEWVE